MFGKRRIDGAFPSRACRIAFRRRATQALEMTRVHFRSGSEDARPPTLQALLDQPQSPFDFTDIGRHRAGMSERTEHHEPPWIGVMKTARKD